MKDVIDGKILKKYDVLKKIGKGAYGQVWKANNKQLKEVCALKKICDCFRNPVDCRRTYREIRYLQLMDHSNIIKLHQVYISERSQDLYLQMNFVESDLTNAIRNDYLNDIQKQYVFTQIVAGVHYLHSAQLIHRDLKPDNILVGASCDIKLCDFGLIRSIYCPQPLETANLRLSDNIATMRYKSPELLLSAKQYGKPVDIWSIGCILAELFLGRAIFQGNSTFNQLQTIIELLGLPLRNFNELLTNETSIAILNSLSDIYEIANSNPNAHDTLQMTSSSQLTRTSSGSVDYNVASSSKFRGSIRGNGNKHSFQRVFSVRNIDPLALDLLMKMLVFDPRKRLTIEEVLVHPYLLKYKQKVELKACPQPIIIKEDYQVLRNPQKAHICFKSKLLCLGNNDERRLSRSPTPNHDLLTPRQSLSHTKEAKSRKVSVQLKKGERKTTPIIQYSPHTEQIKGRKVSVNLKQYSPHVEQAKSRKVSVNLKQYSPHTEQPKTPMKQAKSRKISLDFKMSERRTTPIKQYSPRAEQAKSRKVSVQLKNGERKTTPIMQYSPRAEQPKTPTKQAKSRKISLDFKMNERRTTPIMQYSPHSGKPKTPTKKEIKVYPAPNMSKSHISIERVQTCTSNLNNSHQFCNKQALFSQFSPETGKCKSSTIITAEPMPDSQIIKKATDQIKAKTAGCSPNTSNLHYKDSFTKNYVERGGKRRIPQRVVKQSAILHNNDRLYTELPTIKEHVESPKSISHYIPLLDSGITRYSSKPAENFAHNNGFIPRKQRDSNRIGSITQKTDGKNSQNSSYRFLEHFGESDLTYDEAPKVKLLKSLNLKELVANSRK